MEAIVRLYSSERDEIHKFLSKYFNDKNLSINLLEWEKKYQNPVEIAEIIGTFIDNFDDYNISMWIERKYSTEYSDCPARGLRLKFYDGFDPEKFIDFCCRYSEKLE